MFPASIETIVHDRSIETYALLRLLRKELPGLIPTNLPIIALNKHKTDQLTVYKNIQFDVANVKRKIKFDCPTFNPALESLEKTAKYSTPFKHLKVKENLKVTSFLIKYLNLPKMGLKSNEIRDIANNITHTLHKNLLKVVVCKSLKDHVTLYEVHAFSCMSPKNGDNEDYDDEYTTDLKTYLYKKYGLWPSMWYHYNPHTKGAFLRVGGRGVARTILLREDTKQEFDKYYRSIYAESWFYRDKFEDCLKRKGLRSLNSISINTAFTVPAIKIFKIPICPIPFHDCISRGHWCHFDSKKNVFHFGPQNQIPSPSKVVGSPYTYNGYMGASLNPAHRIIKRSEFK